MDMMEQILQGVVVLMMCLLGGLLGGICMMPFYFMYAGRKKVLGYFYNKIPSRLRILLRAKHIRNQIVKKIHRLKIEDQSSGLLKKIGQIINPELIQLLRNKEILSASCQEADTACKFHKEHKSDCLKELELKKNHFEAELKETNDQINRILHFLDNLSLSLNELRIKGLPVSDQVDEVLRRATADLSHIISSEEEVASLGRKSFPEASSLRELPTASRRPALRA
jgi:hypothetical protein